MSHSSSKASHAKERLGTRNVSIVALDSLSKPVRLIPGEPVKLAPGVTISVLEAASEALLEIENNASSLTFISGQPTSELATIQTGQVVRTSSGQYVMIGHMESFLPPKDRNLQPSAGKKQAISAAVSALKSAEEKTHKNGLQESIAGSTFFGPRLFSNKLVLRSVLVLSALIVTGLLYLQHLELQKVNANLAEVKSPDNTASGPAASGLTTPSSEKSSQDNSVKAAKVIEPNTLSARKDLIIDSDKDSNVTPGNFSQAKKLVKAHTTTSGSSTTDKGAQPVRLTEAERNTVMGYKLEAKFDRNNARAKLKHFANSFPVGSPARLEVERAYHSI